MSLKDFKDLPSGFWPLIRSFRAFYSLPMLAPQLSDLAAQMQAGGCEVYSRDDDLGYYAQSIVQPDGDVLTKWNLRILELHQSKRLELGAKHTAAVNNVFEKLQEGGFLLYAAAMQGSALMTWFFYVRWMEWHFDVCLVAKAAGAFLIWKLVALGIREFGFYLFRRKVGKLIGINLTESSTRL